LDHRCFFCFSRAFDKLLENEDMNISLKEEFVKKLAVLYISSGNVMTAPEFSREMHALLRKMSGNEDHYKDCKKEYNDIALSLYKGMKDTIRDSADPFGTALRMAIAGNIIDFGAHDNFDVHAVIQQVLDSDPAIDHSELLKKMAGNAGRILYIGDNAGEIVFDRLFIETLGRDNIIYTVRGAPILNDVTIGDYYYTGMNNAAGVISNGYDAPSTILDKCSPEFRRVFNEADLIIAKGQGNLEGLLEVKDKDIFFLLMTKCNIIADLLKVRKGDFIAAYNALM
jgi:damage-control phosphatase, subfamily I